MPAAPPVPRGRQRRTARRWFLPIRKGYVPGFRGFRWLVRRLVPADNGSNAASVECERHAVRRGVPPMGRHAPPASGRPRIARPRSACCRERRLPSGIAEKGKKDQKKRLFSAACLPILFGSVRLLLILLAPLEKRVRDLVRLQFQFGVHRF